MTSMLFVPANAPDKFLKAQSSGARALILDLEDSVPPSGKHEARRNAVSMLRTRAKGTQQIWVRVNAAPTDLMLEELAQIVPHAPFGIMLPKCSGRSFLREVASHLDAIEARSGIAPGQTRLLAIATETAASLFYMHEYIGATERLWGLAWGAEDLSADIGASSNQDEQGCLTEPYRLARSLCLLAATAARVKAIDAVCVDVRNVERVRQEAQEAVRDGFSAKMAIHPAQLSPIHEAFIYPAEKVVWAREVVAAFEREPHAYALTVQGRMVDAPHLKMARRILAGLTD